MVIEQFIENDGPVGHRGYNDLALILTALYASPDKKFAVTGDADIALHSMLDSEQLAVAVTDLLGPDARLVHNPDAWGTPEYGVAWENTREAFRAQGIDIDADPAVRHGDGRHAELCWLSIQRVVN